MAAAPDGWMAFFQSIVTCNNANAAGMQQTSMLFVPVHHEGRLQCLWNPCAGGKWAMTARCQQSGGRMGGGRVLL
jgi:hypothetical protein